MTVQDDLTENYLEINENLGEKLIKILKMKASEIKNLLKKIHSPEVNVDEL